MTTTTTIQRAPYLRVQRHFPPDDLKELSRQVDQTYIDIASKVNIRAIGIYSVLFPSITGESWYLEGQPKRQQTLRQVYPFTAAGSIPHGINFNSTTLISRASGSYTDGTNYYGALYASSVAIAGQVSFYITEGVDGIGGNIVIIADGGAPAITSGIIILDWLSNF